MPTLPESLQEYRSLLQQGTLQQAYRGLMQYLMDLRTHFQKHHPDDFVSGSLYSGYMDMSYFSFAPPPLRQRGLKVAVVFLHEAFRFEAWLAGANRQVQAKYWQWFREPGSDRYRLVPDPRSADAILEHTLVSDPDFGNLDALTERIESGTLRFSRDVEAFLEQHGG